MPADLDERRASVARVAPPSRPLLLLFPRAGFEPNLPAEAEVRLISSRDLFDRRLNVEAVLRERRA